MIRIIKKLFFKTEFLYPPTFFDVLYTFIFKKRFKHFGRNSFIRFPCTIRNPQSIFIGDNVFIREHAWLNATKNEHCSLIIGDNTYIGRFIHINAYRSVTIEDHVLIADRVFISDVDHEFRNTTIPIINQGITDQANVKICSGCWLGIGAVILPGVIIGHNSVAAANAVVTHNVPDRTIMAGVPAVFVKKIKEK